MRTNSMIVVVVSCLSILIGDGNARIVAEDAPADALDPVNRTSKGNVSELMRKTKRGYALSEIRLASAPLLAEMASEHGYRLEQDQVLRRIAPPYPEVRATYYKVGHPWQAQAIPTPANGMTFYWDGEKLAQWGMTFGAAYRLTDIVDYALKIKPPDIEGTKEFLERRLEGDWVVRPGAGEEQFLKEFETILQKEFELPVRLMFAKRVRTVYVARGNYHYIPVERDANKNANEANERIEIYGSELSDPNLGGGGGGKLKDFLAWVGRISQPKPA